MPHSLTKAEYVDKDIVEFSFYTFKFFGFKDKRYLKYNKIRFSKGLVKILQKVTK